MTKLQKPSQVLAELRKGKLKLKARPNAALAKAEIARALTEGRELRKVS